MSAGIAVSQVTGPTNAEVVVSVAVAILTETGTEVETDTQDVEVIHAKEDDLPQEVVADQAVVTQGTLTEEREGVSDVRSGATSGLIAPRTPVAAGTLADPTSTEEEMIVFLLEIAVVVMVAVEMLHAGESTREVDRPLR